MKLTILLITVFTVSVSAAGFSQNKINLDVRRSAISDAISKIESQTSYRFLYNESLEAIRKKVSVKIEDADINSAMKELLKETGLSYQLLENQLVVIKEAGAGSPQDVVVTGKVVDSKGEPLIGVSVKIKGTARGVSTDVDGNFKVSASSNAVLVISYLGYETREYQLSGEKNLRVVLKESVSQLDEVVVVGYGAVKKRDVTGSVGSVSSEVLTAKGTTSVMGALQGAVAGVNISSSSPRPGGSFNIQIRGQNSMNASGSRPLYVVDGIVMDNIDFLNPADIEKIDVLKDASSTAIYGSRGSSGVVLVTTKNASVGATARTSVSYDGYYGIRSIARVPDFLEGRDWVDFRTSAYYEYNPKSGFFLSESSKGAILQGSKILQQRLYDQNYTDWLKLGTQDGRQQNHFVNIAGISNKMSYNLGVGYQNEKGNFVKENLDKYTLKLGVVNKISDKVTIGANANLAHTNINQGSQNGYRDLFRMAPILAAYDANGNIIEQPGVKNSIEGNGNFTSSGNPLIEINSGDQEDRMFDVLGSAYVQFTPVEGLEFKSTFMPRFNRTRKGYYYGVTPDRKQDLAYQENTEAFDYTWDNQITYRKTLGKDHNINATLINSWYKTRDEAIQVQTSQLPYNSEWYNIFTGTLQSNESNSSYSEAALLSYAARVNYEYKGKYLVTGTVRYDGSSKLADKWRSFPSFALAWRAGEEEFLKTAWLSDLKARFSFGYSGNNSGINPYGSQQTPIANKLLWYNFGEGSPSVVSGLAPGSPVNTSITWEKTRELNFGLDFGFFNQRIYGSADYYNKLSDGLLMSRSLAVESGVGAMTDNVGSVRNKGVELALTTVNIRNSKLQWTTSVNFAYNKNSIETLNGGKKDDIGNTRFIGKPINVIYDYKIVGIWKSSQAAEAAKFGQVPGNAIPADIKPDGVFNSEDRVVLGQVDPKWTANLGSTLTYKNWDFSFNIYTRQGTFVSDNFLAEFSNAATGDRGRPKVKLDYFVPANLPRYDWNNWNTSAGYPQAVWGSSGAGNENAKYPTFNLAGGFYGNNGRYTTADFVKVRNIVLGYTLPKSVVSRLKLGSVRFYANVLNPFTFTDYVGWDPEYATTTQANGNGPSNITYQFGVNLKF
ncbi:TonB-dependent receptor [Arcticibacter sp. MXS-1]|uniref:TonB-dependent receptor n=1 Tax=Arcticibacter sp. MXS-1 TaxID=3341726 RepID=UPI0035A888F6